MLIDVRRGSSRPFVGAIVAGAVASACAMIMGVDEPHRIHDQDALLPGDGSLASEGGAVRVEAGEILDDGGCLGAGCPCTSDDECRAPFVKCVSSGCVQCVATPVDTCPVGSYCTDRNACATGCRTHDECAALTGGISPFCDVVRHQCVGCLEATDCPPGKACSPSGTCTDTCTGSSPCSGEKTCCDGYCVDLSSDQLNCSGCGMACSTKNGLPACKAGACTWTCDPGYMHCQEGNTGCETDIAKDPSHCGSCSTNCVTTVANATGIFCSVERCSYTACSPGFANCDGNKTNGCECACGGKDQTCCPGGTCNDPADRCFDDGKCHPCLGKLSPCSSSNDRCCNGCNTAPGKCR